MMLCALSLFAEPSPPGLLSPPEPGDVVVYDRRRTFTDPKDDFVVDEFDRVTVRVNQRDTNGHYAFTLTVQPQRAVVDGLPRAFPADHPPSIVKETRCASGLLVTRSDAPISPSFEHRLANVLTVPVIPGPEGRVQRPGWTAHFVRDPWPKVASRVEVVAFVPGERPNRVRVRVTNREETVDAPMTAIGQATIRLDTGWVETLDLEVANAIIPGGDGDPVRLRVRLEAREWKLVPERTQVRP